MGSNLGRRKDLLNVQQTYGKAFEKLLLFPGDWHILKNFRPVIRKLYYHAGLRELAKISGFQGSMLSSLENCSNFKHAHRFLLQVWETLFREMLNVYLLIGNLGDMTDSTKCTSILKN